MNVLEEKLLQYAKSNLNVMMIGSHGIGKSSIVKQLADTLKLNFKYFSSSTLDPFCDIVGIPCPDKDAKIVEYYRPKQIQEAELIFFDEINRAHPRVLNAILEIVQFKTVNGEPLPKLKMVWAAMNPPGDNYQVEELDPALIDRFHAYVKLVPELNLEYLATKMSAEALNILKGWWETNLDDNQKRLFSPRRVEYVGFAIDKKLPFRDFFPQGHEFPFEFLMSKVRKLYQGNLNSDDLDPTKDNIVANPMYFKDRAKEDPKLYTIMYGVIQKFDREDLYKILDLFEEFPKDLIVEFSKSKWPGLRREMKKELLAKNTDFSKYPKITEAFEWNKDE